MRKWNVVYHVNQDPPQRTLVLSCPESKLKGRNTYPSVPQLGMMNYDKWHQMDVSTSTRDVRQDSVDDISLSKASGTPQLIGPKVR